MQHILRPEAMWTYIFHEPINFLKGVFSCLAQWTNQIISGVILETEGSVRKIQKKALFPCKKVKKGTLNLTSPYVDSLCTIVLIKQIFEKNKSLWAASRSQTQFQSKITPDYATIFHNIVDIWHFLSMVSFTILTLNAKHSSTTLAQLQEFIKSQSPLSHSLKNLFQLI